MSAGITETEHSSDHSQSVGPNDKVNSKNSGDHNDASLSVNSDNSLHMILRSSKCIKGEKLSWDDILHRRNTSVSKADMSVDTTVKQYGNLTIEKHSVSIGRVMPSYDILKVKKYAKQAVNSIPILHCKGTVTKEF